MTEKRFIELHKDCRVIKNTQTGETATYYDTEDGLMFLKWLNNLSDENEELKYKNQCTMNGLIYISKWVKLSSDKAVADSIFETLQLILDGKIDIMEGK